jgi:hypothetical protein
LLFQSEFFQKCGFSGYGTNKSNASENHVLDELIGEFLSTWSYAEA